MPLWSLLAGPLFTLAFAVSLLFWLSWRNQNSPLVKKEDRWQPPSRKARAHAVATMADFDPNVADFPLADYASGVIVPIRPSLASVVPLPLRASVLRFPIERIEDRQAPPPPPYQPSPKARPRLRLVKPLK